MHLTLIRKHTAIKPHLTIMRVSRKQAASTPSINARAQHCRGSV